MWQIMYLLFFVLALVFLIVNIALRKTARPPESEMQQTTAVVAGFSRDQHSRWHTLKVRIPELPGDRVYQCQSGRISTKDYPIGSEVQVYYHTERHFGSGWTIAYLAENMPPRDEKLALVFGIMSSCCGLAGAAIMLVSMITGGMLG